MVRFSAASFQSTPPREGVTRPNALARLAFGFQSTPPREGVTGALSIDEWRALEFQSTPPREGVT